MSPHYFHGLAYGELLSSALTFIATIAALTAAVWTIIEQRKIARRERTLGIILNRFANEESAKLYNYLLEYQQTKARPDGKTEDPQVREALNMYEYISYGARTGILDLKVIFDLRGGSMRRTFKFFSDYINGQRQADGNTRLWEHYEWFATNC